MIRKYQLSGSYFWMNKNNYSQVVLAAGIGFFLSLFIYLLFLQTPYTAKREFAYLLLLWLILVPLTYLLLSRFLLPRLLSYSPKARRNWILLTVGVGILFALVTRPPQVLLLLPVHHLQITVPAGSADRSIKLEYAKIKTVNMHLDLENELIIDHAP